MSYEFSFNTRQWWALVAACVLVVILAFAIGVMTGIMWTQPSNRAPVHAGERIDPSERREDGTPKPAPAPPPSAEPSGR